MTCILIMSSGWRIFKKEKTINGYSYLCQKIKKGVGHGSPSSYNTAYCPWIWSTDVWVLPLLLLVSIFFSIIQILLIKQINSIWMMEKKKKKRIDIRYVVKLCVKIDKVFFFKMLNAKIFSSTDMNDLRMKNHNIFNSSFVISIHYIFHPSILSTKWSSKTILT